MNIYGYQPYPYNQSDELAKQTFAQQALASSIPFPNRDMAGAHVMPAPSGTPWNVQGVPWGMSSPPGLVQFTAPTQQAIPHREVRLCPAIQCKRKSLDVEPVIPAKQRITEEKMAAHLNGLHISSEYTPHYLAGGDPMETNTEPFTATVEKLKGHTIVLSEELKKLQEEPLLPAALIDRALSNEHSVLSHEHSVLSHEHNIMARRYQEPNRLAKKFRRQIFEKPRMSLVVWKPRENILAAFKEDEKNSKKKEEEPQKRNGLLVTSHQVTEDVEM